MTTIDEEKSFSLEEANARKTIAEARQIERELDRAWWQPAPRFVLQAAVAGIVAGALMYAFALDNVVKNYQFVKEESERLEDERQKLQQTSQSLTEERDELKQRETKQLADRKALDSAVEVLEAQLREATEELSRMKSAELTEVTRADLDQSIGEIAEISAELSGGQNQNNHFAVIATVAEGQDVQYSYRNLRDRFGDEGKVQVYRTVDKFGKPVYAITLGSYVSREEAERLVELAIDDGLNTGPYVWQSSRWGDDVSARFD